MAATAPGELDGDLRVDADVHNVVGSVQALLPYLSSYWQEQVTATGFSGPGDELYPEHLPSARRAGAPEGDERPGTSPATLRAEVLRPGGTDLAVLNCSYAVDGVHNLDAAAALASAVNEWQLAEWLAEPRLRASLVVASQSPELAVSEIARRGDEPGFVQVAVPARSPAPYGRRQYHRVFAAAVAHDLAVAIGFGGFSGQPPTAVGWPTYRIEEEVGMATVMQAQLMSLIAEGVFERFRELRVCVVDGGFTWLPAFLWRLDKEWKGMRREVPWVRRPPSEYVREHVRFTTTPVDAPAGQPEALQEVLEEMWGPELLLHSSHYPHWRSPRDDLLAAALDHEALARVRGENAASFYRLHADRERALAGRPR